MADVHSRETRSRNMAAIRGKDTKPEVLLRKALFKRGYRYRKNDKRLPGKPDLVFPAHRAVIEVQGCFWHLHQCAMFKWPATDGEKWRRKLHDNWARDARTRRRLRLAGWRVGIVWECALRGPKRRDLSEVVDLVEAWLDSTEPMFEISGERDAQVMSALDQPDTPVQDFLNEFCDEAKRVFIKRLAANDTLATDAHQAGPYLPRRVVVDLFPHLESAREPNPRQAFQATVWSQSSKALDVNLIWYNQKTRNESRITRWGGRKSQVLDPESTGAITVFAFEDSRRKDGGKCHVWVCRDAGEEELVEQAFGVVEPGQYVYRGGDESQSTDLVAEVEPTYPVREEQLALWTQPGSAVGFPTGEELVQMVLEQYPAYSDLPPDQRLLKRREAEFRLFRELEQQIVMPEIERGYADVDAFVRHANSVTNRRKSRAGHSLELQLMRILIEEGVTGFGHDVATEGSKRPDFVFPSIHAYHDDSHPPNRLRMLACKTTVKDRWRQVIDEAERIAPKHLLTLQEGVSVTQFRQMKEAGILLVIPDSYVDKYPRPVRPDLLTLTSFLEDVRSL